MPTVSTCKVTWDTTHASELTLTNGNLTRKPGCIVIDDKTAGPCLIDCPAYELPDCVAEGIYYENMYGAAPVGSCVQVYFAVGATEAACNAATLLGPYDSLDDDGRLRVCVLNEIERAGGTEATPWFRWRVKLR